MSNQKRKRKFLSYCYKEDKLKVAEMVKKYPYLRFYVPESCVV